MSGPFGNGPVGDDRVGQPLDGQGGVAVGLAGCGEGEGALAVVATGPSPSHAALSHCCPVTVSRAVAAGSPGCRWPRLTAEGSGLRPRPANTVRYATLFTLRLLARRVTALDDELDELNAVMRPLIGRSAPAVLSMYGVGYDVAAKLLVAAGDNPDRLHSKPLSPSSLRCRPARGIIGQDCLPPTPPARAGHVIYQEHALNDEWPISALSNPRPPLDTTRAPFGASSTRDWLPPSTTSPGARQSALVPLATAPVYASSKCRSRRLWAGTADALGPDESDRDIADPARGPGTDFAERQNR